MMSKKKSNDKPIDNLRESINKKFGDGALIPLGKDFKLECEVIPSGSIQLDNILGVGGWPRGRTCEIIGPEASGKTTISLHAIANAQLTGTAAFIDAENALDPKYASKLGVDLESLLLSQPNSGEEALSITEMLVESGQINLIVVDSVAALVPKEELEGEIGDNRIGAQARMMSQFLRRITKKAKLQGCTIIFINQIRQKIGIMFGGGETTPGGRALRFYASIRADIRRIGGIKDGDTIIGHEAKIKIVKNKVAMPFRTMTTGIYYGEGISRSREIIDLGLKNSILSKSGSWMSYKDQRLGNGAQQVIQFLNDNKDVRDDIEKEIISVISLDNDINNTDSVDIDNEQDVGDDI